MTTRKTITSQAGGTSPADPSESPEEGTKSRSCPAPGDPSSEFPASNPHLSSEGSCGAILSWEKFLRAARTKTGLGAVPTAGLPSCCDGEIAARVSVWHGGALCAELSVCLSVWHTALPLLPPSFLPPGEAAACGQLRAPRPAGDGGKNKGMSLYLPLSGWNGPSCENGSSLKPGTIPKKNPAESAAVGSLAGRSPP